MNPKLLLSTVISVFLLTCSFSAVTVSNEKKINCLAKKSLKKKTIQLECIITCAPWDWENEPSPLPKYWQKHIAEHNIIVPYNGKKVHISKGNTYFTYKGKVAIGFHGTYNPPCDMS